MTNSRKILFWQARCQNPDCVGPEIFAMLPGTETELTGRQCPSCNGNANLVAIRDGEEWEQDYAVWVEEFNKDEWIDKLADAIAKRLKARAAAFEN